LNMGKYFTRLMKLSGMTFLNADQPVQNRSFSLTRQPDSIGSPAPILSEERTIVSSSKAGKVQNNSGKNKRVNQDVHLNESDLNPIIMPKIERHDNTIIKHNTQKVTERNNVSNSIDSQAIFKESGTSGSVDTKSASKSTLLREKSHESEYTMKPEASVMPENSRASLSKDRKSVKPSAIIPGSASLITNPENISGIIKPSIAKQSDSQALDDLEAEPITYARIREWVSEQVEPIELEHTEPEKDEHWVEAERNVADKVESPFLQQEVPAIVRPPEIQEAQTTMQDLEISIGTIEVHVEDQPSDAIQQKPPPISRPGGRETSRKSTRLARRYLI